MWLKRSASDDEANTDQRKKMKYRDGKGFTNGRRKFKKHWQRKGAEWKEIHKRHKESLRLKREEEQQRNYDPVEEARQALIREVKQLSKRFWEKDCGAEECKELVQQLHSMLMQDGNYLKCALGTLPPNLIQKMLQFGSEDVREDIRKQLIPSIVKIMKLEIGIIALKTLFKVGFTNSHREQCIRQMYGHVIELMSHPIASPQFAHITNKWTSEMDKTLLMQEFFVPCYVESKSEDIKELKDVLVAKKRQNKKDKVMRATMRNLLRVLWRTNANVDSLLLHSVLRQYFAECSESEKVEELVPLLTKHFAALISSADGARVVMECLLRVPKAQCSTYIHELVDKAEEFLANPNSDAVKGEELIGMLMAIDEGEENEEDALCKRRGEIRKWCTDYLWDLIVAAPRYWLEDPAKASILLLVYKKGVKGFKCKQALDSLCAAVCDPEWTLERNKNNQEQELRDDEDDEEVELAVENVRIYKTIKKLVQGDKEHAESGYTFAERLLKHFEENNDALDFWLKSNRCCYLLIEILQNSIVRDEYKTMLNGHKFKITKVGPKKLFEILKE